MTRDGPVRWLEIAFDYRCNNRCLGCPAASGEGESLSTRSAVAALEEGRSLGADSLWLGGGEPTLRRDLGHIVRHARRLGYVRVRLQTNGMLLAYPDFTRGISEAGVTEVSVSIKGAGPSSHDRLTATPGCFELLCRGIHETTGRGLILEADVLLYRSNTGELPDIVKTFFARGIERFRVWLMAPGDHDEAALAEEPRLSEVVTALEATFELGLSSDPDHVISLHTPPCLLPGPLSRARFFAPDLGLLVVDPSGYTFRLEDSPIEGGAFAPGCEGCLLRSRCNGIRPGYLSRHGAHELRAEEPERPRGAPDRPPGPS